VVDHVRCQVPLKADAGGSACTAQSDNIKAAPARRAIFMFE
jgi:hypothetical protein